MVKERNINRGVVHIVAHNYDGVLYVNENGELSVEIQQMEIWKDKGQPLSNFIKSFTMSGDFDTMLFMEYKSGQRLTGNIRITEQITPIIPTEPEKFLYWNEDGTKVYRDSLGRAIYRYQDYYPSEKFKPKGEIDTLIIL